MRELYPNPYSALLERLHWFALTVRHQHERHVERLLRFQGWETLVPVYKARRAWSDRTKDLEVPLFAGYVFCRFGALEKARVATTPGVAKIVGFGAGPVPLEDREIAEIRRVMESGLALRPWPFLKAGDRVRVERGPLRGLEGTLLRERDSLSLVVGVELLQRSIAVELDPDMISPVRIGPRAVAGAAALREAGARTL